VSHDGSPSLVRSSKRTRSLHAGMTRLQPRRRCISPPLIASFLVLCGLTGAGAFLRGGQATESRLLHGASPSKVSNKLPLVLLPC
jgi:hypothetical protein